MIANPHQPARAEASLRYQKEEEGAKGGRKQALKWCSATKLAIAGGGQEKLLLRFKPRSNAGTENMNFSIDAESGQPVAFVHLSVTWTKRD